MRREERVLSFAVLKCPVNVSESPTTQLQLYLDMIITSKALLYSELMSDIWQILNCSNYLICNLESAWNWKQLIRLMSN